MYDNIVLNNVKISPIKGLSSLNITSSFGNRTFFNGKTGKNVTNFHSGIDLTGGTIVVATSSGTITSVRTSIKGYDEYVKFWKKIGGWVKSASTWAMKALKTVCEFTSITIKESNNLIPSTKVSGSYLGYTIKFGTFSTISTKNSDSDKTYGVEFEHKPGELTKRVSNRRTSRHVTIGKEGVEMGA